MTKSTITIERLEKIKSWRETYGAGSNVMLPAEEAEALALIALAAMDGEPVAIIDQANLDYLRSGADADVWPPEREEMGDVLLYRHAQPAPELKPVGYLFVSDQGAIAYSPTDWGVPGFRLAGQIFGDIDVELKPAPVVPDGYVMVPKEMTDEIGEAIAMQANCCGGIALDIYDAMIAAAPHDTPALNSLQSVDSVTGGWIPVSERMPEREVDVQVYCPDKKEQMVAYLERNELDGYFRFATWRTGEGIYCQPTHWMPLPAAPQEVK